MSTRIESLVTFFQDYNVVKLTHPKKNTERISTRNSKEQEYLLDLSSLLKMERYLIPKIASERVSEPESLIEISFLRCQSDDENLLAEMN